MSNELGSISTVNVSIPSRDSEGETTNTSLLTSESLPSSPHSSSSQSSPPSIISPASLSPLSSPPSDFDSYCHSSPTLIIRHAKKKYSNRKGPRGLPIFDPDILPEETKGIKELAMILLKRGYRPRGIITSPYLRTRRTSEIIAKVVGVDVIIDRNLSEFLGNQKGLTERRSKTYFYPGTRRYNPIIKENKTQFRERATSYGFERGYWYVCHGYFISLSTGVSDVNYLEVVTMNDTS